jgi:hypothetical protein
LSKIVNSEFSYFSGVCECFSRCLVSDHNLAFVKKYLPTIRLGGLHLVDEMVN